MSHQPELTLGTDQHGARVTVPVGGVLAGHSFFAGAPGSGRNDTALQILETLIVGGHRVIAVDTTGDFVALRDSQDVLHLDPDGHGDHRVDPADTSRLLDLAIEHSVPVLLDLSENPGSDIAEDLLDRTARSLLERVRSQDVSALFAVSGLHQCLPEEGRIGAAGRALTEITKQGPARGLGILGTSRLPADVKRDALTDADWSVWHRLDRRRDANVVKRVLGREYAREVSELDRAVGLLHRTWDGKPARVTFDRDADSMRGQPAGLGPFERPDFESIRADPFESLVPGSASQRDDGDRLESIRADLDAAIDRIERLETEAAFPAAGSTAQPEDRAYSAQRAAGGDPSGDRSSDMSSRMTDTEGMTDNGEMDDDESGVSDIAFGDLAGIGMTGNGDSDDDDTAVADTPSTASGPGDGSEKSFNAIRNSSHGSGNGDDGRGLNSSMVDEQMARLRKKGERLEEDSATGPSGVDPDRATLMNVLDREAVAESIDAASDDSLCTREQAWSIVGALLAKAPASLDTLARGVPAAADGVESLLGELRRRNLVDRVDNGRYRLDVSELRSIGGSNPRENQTNEFSLQGWDA